jgi:hypothetical protein
MQRPVGSVGVEALLDHKAIRSFDNYCGVNVGVAVNSAPALTRAEGNFSPLNATPQKSFGLREATIHAHREIAKSEHP